MGDQLLILLRISLTPTLMKQLAIQLGCQNTAAKSLVISRKREKEQT